MLNNLLSSIISYFVIYIKIFQWVNVETPGYFNRKLFRFLQIFINKVHYVESDINYNALRLLQNNGFSIDKTPINAGTISLVYVGYYKNEKFAIKVKRNNIDDKVKGLFNNLRFFGRFSKLIGYPLADTINNIEERFNNQTNFNKELENILLFNTIKHDLIHNLEVVQEFCNNDIIVMKFIEGETIYQIKDQDKEECLNTLLKTTSYLNFYKSIFHLDCHPGNILFIKSDNKYKISYIDLGIIMIIKDMNELDIIFRLCLAITSANLNKFVEIIKNSENGLFVEYDNLKIELFCKDIISSNLFNKKSIVILKNDLKFMLSLICKYDLKMCNSFYNYLLNIITVCSVISHLDSDNKYFDIISNQLNKFM